MSEHMVTESPGLNLSSILTSTIVWGGLQRQNVYQSRLRARTHQAGWTPLSVCGWPTPHSFYSMFSTIGASWRLIGSCPANWPCWKRAKESRLTEHTAHENFTHSVQFFIIFSMPFYIHSEYIKRSKKWQKLQLGWFKGIWEDLLVEMVYH